MNTACSHCLGLTKRTNWRPKKGLDPHLREYRCDQGHKTYYRTGTIAAAARKRYPHKFDH